MGQAAPTAPGRDRFGTAASDTAAEGLAGARPPPSAVVSVRSGRRPAPHGGGQYVDGPARSYSPSAADQDTGTLRCGHTPPAGSGTGTGTGHDRHRPHRPPRRQRHQRAQREQPHRAHRVRGHASPGGVPMRPSMSVTSPTARVRPSPGGSVARAAGRSPAGASQGPGPAERHSAPTRPSTDTHHPSRTPHPTDPTKHPAPPTQPTRPSTPTHQPSRIPHPLPPPRARHRPSMPPPSTGRAGPRPPRPAASRARAATAPAPGPAARTASTTALTGGDAAATRTGAPGTRPFRAVRRRRRIVRAAPTTARTPLR